MARQRRTARENDLSTIEAVFLSHWRADHSGSFPAVVAAVSEARRAAGLPAPLVDLRPDRPDQRGIVLPHGTFALLPPEPTIDGIGGAGGDVVQHREPHAVAGLFDGSGAIDRVTAYETGLVGHHSFRGDVAEPDPLIMDERFVAAHVRGRCVTVLSACSHAGVVNACLGAMAAFPGTPVDVVLGGYHLAGAAMEPRIADTVRDLAERIDPAVVAPGHCTGWRAKAALADAFAPGAMRRAWSAPASASRGTDPSPPAVGNVGSMDRLDVEAIEVDRDSHVTVRFGDRVSARFSIAELRLACPCATCDGRRQRGESVSPAVDRGDVVTITTAELAGAFGLALDWSDGHRTGIYGWSLLRDGFDAGRLGAAV